VAVAVAVNAARWCRRRPSQLVRASPIVIAMSMPAQAVFQWWATAVCGSWVATLTVQG